MYVTPCESSDFQPEIPLEYDISASSAASAATNALSCGLRQFLELREARQRPRSRAVLVQHQTGSLNHSLDEKHKP